MKPIAQNHVLDSIRAFAHILFIGMIATGDCYNITFVQWAS